MHAESIRVMPMPIITTRKLDLRGVLNVWSCDKLILIDGLCRRVYKDINAERRVGPPSDACPPGWEVGKEVGKPQKWLRDLARAVARGLFREERLWEAEQIKLNAVSMGGADATKIAEMYCCELHHTDEVADEVPRPLFAFVVRGHGRAGKIFMAMLSDNLDTLVPTVLDVADNLTTTIETMRGGTAPEEQLHDEVCQAASLDDDLVAEEDDKVNSSRAKSAVAPDRRKKHIEDEKFARKDFATAARVFKKESKWRAESDDAATRLMEVSSEGSITDRALKAARLGAKKELAKMQSAEERKEDPKLAAAFANWERVQRTGSVKQSLSAFELYMRDPKNRVRVESMGL